MASATSMTPPLSTILFLAFAAINLGLLPQPCSAAIGNILYSRQWLLPGQYINWNNYFFIMQTDCNLVLYDGRRAIWASGTYKRGTGCKLTMQSDGNLVIYDDRGNPLWASGTSGKPANYVCVLQSDRNVVIYGPALWATGTNIGDRGVKVTKSFDASAQLVIPPAGKSNETKYEEYGEILINNVA